MSMRESKDEYLVTIYELGYSNGITISSDLATRLGLCAGQRLPSAEFREVLIQSCKEGIAECRLNIAMQEEFDAI